MLRLAFLNCYNLFAVGSPRGPRGQLELQNKIANLALTLGAIFPANAMPHLIGLCEVGAKSLGNRVVELLNRGRYRHIWSGQPAVTQPGLMVLYDPTVLTRTVSSVESGPKGTQARTKWLAVEFQIRIGRRGIFWFIVNHWKSQLGGELLTEPARMESAREIGNFYLRVARISSDAAVMVGDFNCEPGDRPFKTQQVGQGRNAFRGVRERPLVLRDRNRLAFFYNLMWRWLGEPDPIEAAMVPGYQRPRLIGTHGGGVQGGMGFSCWDQVLVTKRLLGRGLIHLHEGSLRVAAPVGGCSDHCAVGVELDY